MPRVGKNLIFDWNEMGNEKTWDTYAHDWVLMGPRGSHERVSEPTITTQSKCVRRTIYQANEAMQALGAVKVLKTF